VDKLTITDGFGKKRSFCKEQGELLPSGIPVAGKLKIGDCLAASPGFNKVGFTGQFLPKKPALVSNIRPPHPNDISKQSHHVDVNEPNLSNFVTDIPPIKSDVIINPLSPVTIPENANYDLTSIPKPLLVPIEPQATLVNLPTKSVPHPQYQNKHDYGITNSIKKTQHWKNKYHNHRPPVQPFHLGGPPGTWNIVTSKPGSLPPPIHVYQSKFSTSKPTNNNGIELQYGPKLPLPPLPPSRNPFPGRRRPSTSGHHPPRISLPPIDMSFAESETTLSVSQSSTEKLIPATERIDVLREEDIIIIDDAKQVAIEVNKSVPIKTDILSDDQLTIFKVGPDNDVERVVNMSSFDQNVTDSESQNYKYVILHKLPNGEAVNLENLKTYNYEDLINGYSSFMDDGPANEEFDRENLEYFDVPRKFSNGENPYIIYQLSEAALQNAKEETKNKYFSRPNGIYPVYKPTTSSTVSSPSSNPINSYIYSATRKSPVFIPKPTPQFVPQKPEEHALSSDDMKLLQTKVDEILSVKPNQTSERESEGVPNAGGFSNVNKFASVLHSTYGSPGSNGVRNQYTVNGVPARTRNVWVPKEVPRNNPNKFQQNKNDKSELNIQKLSKLSQLASVSITDNGPLAETVKSMKEDNAKVRSAQKLTIQLLPPRLSAVLTHLDSPTPGLARSQNSRSILSGFRQNKIAPVFKNTRNQNQDNKLRNMANNRNNYARRISNGEYIITHPYQTQVIPKEEKTRFIPLAPPHKPNQLWWHPSQPSIVNRPPTRHPVFNINSFRESQRRVNYYGHHPPMTNNLKAPPSYPSDSYPARPVQLPHYQDSKLISSSDLLHEQPHGQHVEYKQKVGAKENNIDADRDRKQSKDAYPTRQKLGSTTLSTIFNHHPTIKSVAVNITEETIEKNLERIATLERAATHLQQPFIPSLHTSDKTESSTSPASGVEIISFVKNLENVTFSNFSNQSEHGGASSDHNIQFRGSSSNLKSQTKSASLDHQIQTNSASSNPNIHKKATSSSSDPIIQSRDPVNKIDEDLKNVEPVKAQRASSSVPDQLVTIPASSLKTREKAALSTNNVPTFAPPSATLHSMSANQLNPANHSSHGYEKVLPKTSELPTPPRDTITIRKSIGEEKLGN
jgi:hypothetical protein